MKFEVGQRFKVMVDNFFGIPIVTGGILEVVSVDPNRAKIQSGAGHARFLSYEWDLPPCLGKKDLCLVEPFPALRFKQLDPDAKLPTRAKAGDAGMDVTCVDDGELSDDLSQITYRTGLAMEIPDGYVGLLFPRSSICKTSLALSNSVGVIDAGYRGEVKAVFNRRYHEDTKVDEGEDPVYGYRTAHLRQIGVSDKPYKKGDRIAQLIILPVPTFEPQWADELTDTDRGDGGFGSSGR